jgi:hypothetical protein
MCSSLVLVFDGSVSVVAGAAFEIGTAIALALRVCGFR